MQVLSEGEMTNHEIVGILMTVLGAVAWLWVECMRNPNRYAKSKIGDSLVLIAVVYSLIFTAYNYFKGG